jgi:ribosomal protein S18 acetylase RimI-like enzyme
MNYITLTQENLASEHICCVFGGNNQAGEDLKRAWLSDRIKEGMKFTKLDAKAKVFIEYIPAEFAWRPVEAPDYFFIHCLWVSGRYKGNGHAKELLEICIEDAKKQGKSGVCVVSSKKPFMTDTKFFLKHGFDIVDKADPFFDLAAIKFKNDANNPRFIPEAKRLSTDIKNGIVIYYSDQCPYTDFYINEMAAAAIEREIPYQLIKLENAEQARKVGSPFGTTAVYLNGEFLTHRIDTKKTFGKLLDKNK